MHLATNLGISNGPLSSALARTFRGKLCDVILRNRSVTTFEKGQLIYDAGEDNKTFFFLQKGFVKIGIHGAVPASGSGMPRTGVR